MQAKYDNQETDFGGFYINSLFGAPLSLSKDGFRAKVLTEKYALSHLSIICNGFGFDFKRSFFFRCCINKEVIVEIISGTPLTSFTYVIVGRGKMLQTKTVLPIHDSSVRSEYTYRFNFVPDFNNAPKSTIVVYHIKNRDIVSELLSIDLKDDFENFIELDVVPGMAKPGQIVDINIKSNPNAFIGLLGIDKSVNLVKSGNDLTPDEIWSEMEKLLKTTQRKRKNQDIFESRNRLKSFYHNQWHHFAVNNAEYEYCIK